MSDNKKHLKEGYQGTKVGGREKAGHQGSSKKTKPPTRPSNRK